MISLGLNDSLMNSSSIIDLEFIIQVNSMWPSDTIRHRSGSTLAHLMACHLTAPSHYLNQCLLIIREVQWQSPGPRFNIKMTSYRYRKSHCGDKTVVRSSYLHNGISYNGKMTSLYWIRALRAISQDKPQPSITKITLKTICLNFHSNLPWISEFIWWAYGTQCVLKYSFSSRYSTFFVKYPN